MGRERLSTHFYRDEFACNCGCGLDTVDAKLLTVLQWLRYEIKKPITITSAARCPKHNRSVGGAMKSRHMVCKAADIKVEGMPPAEVFQIINKHFTNLGLICYPGWVHVDSRATKYRKGPTALAAEPGLRGVVV